MLRKRITLSSIAALGAAWLVIIRKPALGIGLQGQTGRCPTASSIGDMVVGSWLQVSATLVMVTLVAEQKPCRWGLHLRLSWQLSSPCDGADSGSEDGISEC
jgi:hypothetical protein